MKKLAVITIRATVTTFATLFVMGAMGAVAEELRKQSNKPNKE